MIIHKGVSHDDGYTCAEATDVCSCNSCKKVIQPGEYIGYISVPVYWCLNCDEKASIPIVQKCVSAWKRYKRLERLKKIKAEVCTILDTNI